MLQADLLAAGLSPQGTEQNTPRNRGRFTSQAIRIKLQATTGEIGCQKAQALRCELVEPPGILPCESGGSRDSAAGR